MSVVALTLPLLAACATASPTPTVQMDPMEVAAPGSGLTPVAFMFGCWRGLSASGTTVIEERYGPPDGGVMLGTTRYLRDDRVVGFEFTLIDTRDGVISFVPHPSGVRSEHAFTMTDSGPGFATFEAPEHDYPKRILYRRNDAGGLDAQIDSGASDSEPRRWTITRVACG